MSVATVSLGFSGVSIGVVQNIQELDVLQQKKDPVPNVEIFSLGFAGCRFLVGPPL